MRRLEKGGNKRGQFYLVTTIMIIAIILGFVSLTNFVNKRSSLKFYYEGEELAIESEKVLDYSLSQSPTPEDTKNNLNIFINNFTKYSEANNFYFMFGNNNSLNFSGLQKLRNGQINISSDSNPGTIIPMNAEGFSQSELPSQNVGDILHMKIERENDDVLEFDFEITDGTNFHYVFFRDILGDRYLETNA